MSGVIRISLRAGETIFINGALVSVDRKTSLEFRNNVTFLLENHMLKEDDAVTPLRKMYLNLQKLLIEPQSGFTTRQNFYEMHTILVAASPCDELVDGLMEVKNLINIGRNFEALKKLRKLFEIEDAMMMQFDDTEEPQLKVSQGG